MLNISCLDKALTIGMSQPDEILNETRKLIIESLRNDGSATGGKDGMDCSLIVLDHENKKLLCASANNPVWIVRNNPGKEPELIEIKGDRLPVGKHEKDQIPFIKHEINLLPGDTLYLLTDGYPDQFGGPYGKKFKYKQLQDLLLKITHESMNTQLQILTDVFQNWKGELEQVDDVCIAGIRIS
jgi:serine phosphatase RsbU (regulator of sigma subunit)